jgi:hypothetical protein
VLAAKVFWYSMNRLATSYWRKRIRHLKRHLILSTKAREYFGTLAIASDKQKIRILTGSGPRFETRGRRSILLLYTRVGSCDGILLATGLKEPGPSILCFFFKLEIEKKKKLLTCV